MHKIFVYGTLKRGSSRSMECMYPKSKFVKKLKVKGFTLFKQPFRKAPVMIYNGKDNYVNGEVYLVTNETLKILDKREGVKTGWYSREYFVGTHMHVYMWNHTTLFFKHLGHTY